MIQPGQAHTENTSETLSHASKRVSTDEGFTVAIIVYDRRTSSPFRLRFRSGRCPLQEEEGLLHQMTLVLQKEAVDLGHYQGPGEVVPVCSRSQDSADAGNPGNNLYVTGLSTRITTSDLENYFNKEGKVVECHLVTDPRTKESRGFGFVTMETKEDAECCIKYLNRSVFEGRLITVEKAKRSRGRTSTPGRYYGSRDKRGHGWRRSRCHSPKQWQDRDYYSRDQRGRSRSPYNRRVDDYSDSYRRRRDWSLSAGDSRHPR